MQQSKVGEEPLLKFGANVIVKKRFSNNRRIKGFEPVGRTARYLGTINDTSEGRYVLLEDEDGKVMRTTSVVPYDEKEREDEEQDLKEAGWIWLTDPDGRVFFLSKYRRKVLEPSTSCRSTALRIFRRRSKVIF